MAATETSYLMDERRRRMALAAFCAMLVLACPLMVAFDNGEHVEEADGIVPIVFLAAAIIILVETTYIAYDLASNYGDSSIPAGTTDDSVNATLRQLQAQLVTSNYGTASGIWSQLAVNDAQLWSFVESYFDAQAETAVASLWSDSGSYDGDKILEASSLIANSLVYNYNVTGAWNEFSLSWSEYRDGWAADPAYDSMSLVFGWDGRTWSSDGVFSAELMRYAVPTSTSDLVYIEVVQNEEEGWGDRTDLMYCHGGDGTLTSTTTGRTYTLSEGENDLLGLGVPSGWYRLGTGATYIYQNLSGSVSSDGLMPSACMLLRNGDGYAFAYESGRSYVLIKDGVSSVTDSLTLSVSYDDKDGNRVDGGSADLGKVLSAYTDVSDALNHAALSANYAGETAWNVYDMLGKSSVLLKPSSITTGTQTDIPLTTQQAAVMYIAAMEQIAALGENTTVDGIAISPDSMGLYCHGDIYYEGVPVLEGAVFTPFVYSDTTISVGTQTLNVNGLAMVWATGVQSLDDWNGVTSGCNILSISGATLDTLSIVSDGTETSSIELQTASMERLGLIGFDVPVVPDPPKTVNIVPLLQIIIVLAGAMLALVGVFIRQPWLILIGVVVAVLGFLLAGWIAGLIW